jgi:hypothetical protein
MAISPTLRQARKRVAEALGEFAREQKWDPQDYKIFVRANKQWGHLQIILVLRDLEKLDYYDMYSTIWNFLREKLKDEPELVNYLGLVLRSFRQVEEGGIYTIEPDYMELKTSD